MFPTDSTPTLKSNPDHDEKGRAEFVLRSTTKSVAQVAKQGDLLSDLIGIQGIGLLRIVGYTLVIFAYIDLLYAVIPPKFTDPVWEFQTIGEWFERVPVLLLGCILAFYQGPNFRRRLERHILRFLSWLNLILAIILLLLVPLCVNDAVQINRLNNAEINVQLDEQTTQLNQAKTRILRASDDELETLLLPEEQAAQVPEAPRTIQAAKEVALSNLDNAEEQSRSRAERARENLKRNLFKNTVRLTLGCALSAFTLLYSWKLTDWARNFQSYRQAIGIPNQSKKSRKPMGLLRKKATKNKVYEFPEDFSSPHSSSETSSSPGFSSVVELSLNDTSLDSSSLDSSSLTNSSKSVGQTDTQIPG